MMSKLVETLKKWQETLDENEAMVMEIVITTIEKLEKFKAFAEPRLDRLNALEAYGVDNWEGYGDAMASLDGDEDDE